MSRQLDRRAVLATVASGLVGSVTGCLSGPSFPDADVVAGPGGDLVFDPPELAVSPATTVSWGFASSGHNVSCRPADGKQVALPDAAAPFASYGPDESPVRSTVRQGRTYQHTFEAAGTYRYVCVPHAERGMVGAVRVE